MSPTLELAKRRCSAQEQTLLVPTAPAVSTAKTVGPFGTIGTKKLKAPKQLSLVTGSSDGSELSEETSWPAFESSAESEDLAVHLYPGAVTIQGVLRRKTLLKEGKKPTVASWTKYWAALCGTQLFYYTAKSLKATERKHFKSTPSKNVSVVGWMVMMADDPEHPDLFLLTDSEKGNSYKFQAGNRMNAMLWFKHLSAACQSNRQQVRTIL
ncbi:Ras-specific guanine nucleotide-releasing factor RalGPS2 [Chelonia mydas]|uniref:Ras-specific guanine nucleotide-releasing factor RalGPS2 n=1 Tax=Chelonia mydas TaxID=8469 RepID=M7B960_CHEMY|nr:Ras-specific guanine nucleotide-releasing factor RalGPS2 [Chelonia mydas]